jgi:hypothetical protein
MGYEFKTDINIEYPFFTEMVGRLDGTKGKMLFNGREKYQVRCPRCNKNKAVMGYAKTKDSFVLVCPVDECDLNGVVLHDLIKRYGGEEMFGRWRKARWTSTYSEDWLPIKSRKIPDQPSECL